MTDKDIQELFKNMPEDIVQGFKNLAEAFKRKDVEYEHKELLRYRTLREREQRKESLPEPEFTKAKRAEQTSEATSEVTSEISEDLEKELSEVWKDWANEYAISFVSYKQIAKHFFELGLKAQKGGIRL